MTLRDGGIILEKNSIPKATLGRLPDYLQYLKIVHKNGDEFISATTIAKKLFLGEVQVRKDLSLVSGAGKPKVGYETSELIYSIEKALGRNNLTCAVIVGAGSLGKALLNYEGFKEFGVNVNAAFDIVPDTSSGILSMEKFDSYCNENNIKIGIITSSKSSAQEICNKMTEKGIKAIWNFTPQKLNVPDGVILKQENLALSLAHLNNQLNNKN